MRITIVSYHFTPSTMVAALRARGLAKYLSRAGHSVTVVTAEEDPEASTEWRTVTVPGRTLASRVREALGVSQHHTIVDAVAGRAPRGPLAVALRAARRSVQELLFWPDDAAGWSRGVRQWLRRSIASGQTELVISTSPPASAHVAVLKAGRRGIPWVADYRDLWTLAHHYPLSPLRRALDRRTEARIIRKADAVTVATDGFAEVVRAAFPEASVSVVHNGFDPEMFELPLRPSGDRRLRLLHAGSLYGGRVDPGVLFAALASLLESDRVPADRLHVDFFSAKEAWLDSRVSEHGLGDVVTVHGTQPRENVIQAYAASDVLVLLQWDDPGEATVLPAKMLEYLASRRYILAVGSHPGGEVDRMLASTGSGTIVREVGDTADAIAALYEEFDRTGSVSVKTDDDARAPWTQMAMAASMQESIATASAAAARCATRG